MTQPDQVKKSDQLANLSSLTLPSSAFGSLKAPPPLVLSSPDEAITLRAASRGDAEIFWRYSPNNLDEALSSNVDHNKYQPIIVPSREWLEEKLKGVEQSFSISLVISLVPGQFDASTYVPHARIPSSSFSL